MSRLRLTVATGDYDITRPVIDGTATAPGLDLVAVTMPSPQRHWRMLMHKEFDVAELSLGSFAARVSRGEDDLVGVPVFPHRRFRHGYAFVPTSSPVRRAADLAGRRVGVRSWQTTAGVWLRGILEEYHGLPLDSVQWVAQDGEDVPLMLPEGLELTRVTPGDTVTDLCARGLVDALVYPELPAQAVGEGAALRRLFADPKAAEQEYFRRTGIFPIMHVVAIRAPLVEKFPWLPRTVMEVFEESKRLAIARLTNPRTVSVAWLRALQEEEEALLGTDPWHYGLDGVNTVTLDTFLRYAAGQGVTARPLTSTDLFPPRVTEDMPVYV